MRHLQRFLTSFRLCHGRFRQISKFIMLFKTKSFLIHLTSIEKNDKLYIIQKAKNKPTPQIARSGLLAGDKKRRRYFGHFYRGQK